METLKNLETVWGAASRGRRVRVLGAATAVGRELVCRLLELGHPLSQLSLAALKPHTCSWHGQELHVYGLSGAFPPVEMLFLCSAHEQAVRQAEHEMCRGARVIDLAGVYNRGREAVLAAPGSGLPDPGVFTQLVSLPTRSAMLVGPALWALECAFGLEEIHVVALTSAAGDGAKGILELRGELSHVHEQGADPHRVGNVLLAPLQGGDRELILARELGQLIGRPEIPIDASLLRVDAERSDSFSFHLRFRRTPTAGEVGELLGALPGVTRISDLDGDELCPRACRGKDGLRVGRIRTGSRGPGSVCFFAVGDQLRVGGAEAALRLAASLESA